MSGAFLDNRELAQVLELVLNELEKKNILQNVSDRKSLINDTLENIKGGLDDSLSVASLKTPAMKLKLVTALVATFTNEKFDFTLLFGKQEGTPRPALEKALQVEMIKLLDKYAQLEPNEAKAFVELTNTLPKPKPGARSKKTPEEEKFVEAAITDEAGNVIEKLEGVAVPAKNVAASIITLSEMFASDLLAGTDIRETMEHSVQDEEIEDEALDDEEDFCKAIDKKFSNTPTLTRR